MNVKFYQLLRDQFGGGASRVISEILGRSPEQSRPIVDHSTEVVLDSFADISRDSTARERLYKAVRDSDDRVIDDPGVILRGSDRQAALVEGRNQLVNIVGIAEGKRVAEKLQAKSGLSAVEADDVLGYLTPGVLGAMKKQISSGAVTNTASGIAQLVGSGQSGSTVSTTGATASAQTAAAVPAGHSVAATGDSDSSWIRRFALPFLLLGALLLLTMKYCSDAEENRLVVEDRDNLQGELEGVRAEADASNVKLEEANANVVRLQTEVDTVSAELQEVKAVPTETAELQGLLATTSAERDALGAGTDKLQTELDGLVVERDAANEEITRLQTELDDASATLESNADEIANINALKAEVDEITYSQSR